MSLKRILVLNPIGLTDSQLEWALRFFLSELLEGSSYQSIQLKVVSTKHEALQSFAWKFAKQFGYILPPSYLEGNWSKNPPSPFKEITDQLEDSSHSRVLVLTHYSVQEICQLTKLLNAKHRPAFREGQKYFVLSF